MVDLLHAGQNALFIGVIAGVFKRHMTAHEEDPQVMNVEHGQAIIGLRFNLIDLGMTRQFTPRQLDCFFMNRRGRDHIDQAGFPQFDRFQNIVQRHLPRQLLHFAPFNALAVIIIGFQHVQRTPAEASFLRMANFVNRKITAHDFHCSGDNRR